MERDSVGLNQQALKRYNGLEIQPYKDQSGNDTFAIVPIK